MDRDWVRRVARVLDIPFCVAGGIRSVADAEEVLNAGAEKISVNSPALENPALIDDLSERFGSQCVVVGIDSLRTATGLSGLALQRRSAARARRRTRRTGLGARSAGARRRRDRAQLHGERWRAHRLRHRTAAGDAHDLPGAAGGLRRRGHVAIISPDVFTQAGSTRRWPRVCFIRARSASRI